HGPVTAEADHQVIALFSGPLHQFPRMAPILRQHRVHRHVAGERTDNDVARAGGSRCGLRIPDEQRAHAASLLTLPSSTVVDRRPVLRAEGPAEQGTKEAGYSEAVSRRPITLLLAAVCEGLLGVLLFILGGYVLVNTLLGNATDVNFALPLAVFAFGGSAALCYVAWGLFHLKEW